MRRNDDIIPDIVPPYPINDKLSDNIVGELTERFS